MTSNPKKKEKQQYYGSQEKESLTYLEFGGIDLVEGSKSIWDFRIDQEAYDFLMLSRYAKEIIAFNKSLQSIQNGNYQNFIELYKNDVHTQDFLNSILTFKALEFLNQALFNYEIFTVNREKMRINITDKEFDRKSILKDSILNKSRIKDEAEKLLK